VSSALHWICPCQISAARVWHLMVREFVLVEDEKFKIKFSLFVALVMLRHSYSKRLFCINECDLDVLSILLPTIPEMLSQRLLPPIASVAYSRTFAWINSSPPIVSLQEAME
jgi:hypothetical protein